MNIERQFGLRATMPDGVELVADAWVPEGGGPWPVLLQRLPYGRSVAGAETSVGALGAEALRAWHAAHATAARGVVVCEPRLRGGGQFVLAGEAARTCIGSVQ